MSIPAYWARRVFPKLVFIPSLARICLILTVKKTLIPKYIIKANSKYSTLIVSNALYSDSMPTYHSNAAKMATMMIICRAYFRNRLDEFFCFGSGDACEFDIIVSNPFCGLNGLWNKVDDIEKSLAGNNYSLIICLEKCFMVLHIRLLVCRDVWWFFCVYGMRIR